jgi:hypothetical protein
MLDALRQSFAAVSANFAADKASVAGQLMFVIEQAFSSSIATRLCCFLRAP